MKSTDRLGLAVIVALLLGIPLLKPVTADPRLFTWGSFVIVMNGVLGIIGRRLRLAEGLVHLVQIGFGLGFLAFMLSLQRPATPLSMALVQVIDDAVRWVRISAAPMPPNASVVLVGAWAIWMVAVLADMLVVSLGRPAMIVWPLLVLYAVPALAIPTPVSWSGYLALCVGVGVVLLADAANRTAVLRAAGLQTPKHRVTLLAGGAGLLAAAAVGGLAVSAVFPVTESGTWAPLQGRGPITMSDPSLDLRRNLELPEDRRVITYTTDDNEGTYLRLATLTKLDARGWQLEQLALFEGNLPRPPGFAGTGRERRTHISIDDFTSQWLPLPYAPVSFTATGDWRHDTQSLVVLWGGDPADGTLAGTSYDVVSTDVTPSAASVQRARAGVPPDDGTTLRLPTDLPPEVARLAGEVTEGAATDGARALALQNWLRSDRFTYSLEASSGSGYRALTQFLLDDHTGYCEQFAGSMAIMARTLRIPARVAIGFLPGRPTTGGHEVSIRDMHAWPELYFDGLGWVSFEPTPGVSGSPPPYTGGESSATPSVTPRTPTASDISDVPLQSPSSQAPGTGNDEGSDGWRSLVGAAAPWAGAALAGLVLAATPWAIRTLRRRRRAALRAAPERVEAAWDEVRDEVWDTGADWPAGSPRAIGNRIAGMLDAPADAAMRDLATWVERGRYDRSLSDVPDLTPSVTAGSSGMWGRPRLRRRLLRRLFPRSVWRRLRWSP